MHLFDGTRPLKVYFGFCVLGYHFYIAEYGTDWPSQLFLGLASVAANIALMLPFDRLGLMGLIAAAHLCQKLKLPYFYPLFLFIDIGCWGTQELQDWWLQHPNVKIQKLKIIGRL